MLIMPHKLLGLAIEYLEPAPGSANPKYARMIFVNGADDILRVRSDDGVLECLRPAVELIKPGIGDDPKRLCLIFVNALDSVMAQTVGDAFLVLVSDKLFRFPVKGIQASAPCANPEHSKAIRENHFHVIVAEALRVIRLELISNETVVTAI
jgi:hypothetical protein